RLTTDLNRAGIEVEPTRHIAHQIAHRDHRAGGRGVTRRHGWIGRRNETVAKMQKHEHAVPFGAYGLEQHRPSVRAAMRRRRKRKPDRVARWKGDGCIEQQRLLGATRAVATCQQNSLCTAFRGRTMSYWSNMLPYARPQCRNISVSAISNRRT